MSTDNNKLKGVTGLHAVILIANDYKNQLEFYRDTLELEIAMEYEDAVFFKAGEQMLAIFSNEHHAEGTKRLKGGEHGISHLEFNLDESEREAMYEKLRNKGAHAYGDSFEDADGNLFHFVFK